MKLLTLILAKRLILWQCWHANRCWDFPCLPARVVYFCSCSFDKWRNWFFNKRSKPQSKVACQFWHLFGKSWTQFFDCIQIIIHGSWKIHEVVEVNWIIFSLANLDLYRFFMSCQGQGKVGYISALLCRKHKQCQFLHKLLCGDNYLVFWTTINKKH